jgi:hypothetical protein
MPRLCTILAVAMAGAVAAALPAPADARQKQSAQPSASAGSQYRSSQYRQKSQTRPRRPGVIIRDRSIFHPPPLPPSSTERNYYGPAPGIQPPAPRVPLPAPLAPPPIRNP